MSWPRSSDYREVLQHPLRCLHDPELRRARPVHDERGRPHPVAGATADVYEFRGGHDRWALKCFTRTPAGLGARYAVLFTDLLERVSPWLLGFQYLEQGVFIRGRWYPALKMRWCDGLPLDEFARQADAATLDRLAAAWVDLTEQMCQAGMAHTDLHHRHVRVQPDPDGTLRLQLIDYDCLYTPALAEFVPEKKLHPVYQHPQRLFLSAYNAEADRFGSLVIYTALRCLRLAGPELCQRSRAGLLFRQADFAEPATSGLFQSLWRSPDAEVRFLAGRLLLASQGPLTEVPRVRALLEGEERRLTEEQTRAVEALLRGDAEARQAVLATSSELSFNLVLESDAEVSLPAADAARPAGQMSFELTADSDPEITRPGPPTTATLPAIKPPPVPKTVTLAPPPLPPTAQFAVPPMSDFAQSRVKIYRLEAWMPQAVAVVKLQGFVRDLGGQVAASVPGLLRVHLMERFADRPSSDSGWTLRNLFKPSPEPRVLSVVELHLRTSEHEHQTRLRVDVHFYPGADPDLEEMEDRQWQAYCDKTFCELRGFLIHAR